ncbi:hypothetical protein HQ563_00800 [bacterium]|nr:hypothetical protein [bacterium]
MSLKGILVTLVLLGIIALGSYYAATRSKPSEEGQGYTAILMCTNPACKKKPFPQKIIAGKQPPHTCKHCGKKTAYRAVRCDNCGEIFPYVVEQVSTEFGRQEVPINECPECAYDRFTLIRSMAELKESAAEQE